jgi:predicted nucleotidyltransferase
VSEPETFDPAPLIQALADAGVDFVLIGGLAGIAHGSAYPTYDVDVMYARDRDNLERLANVLHDLGATLRGAPSDVPFLLDAETLEKGGNFTFETPRGSLDILAEPAGAPPYAELKAGSAEIDLGGRSVRVASLNHLIAMKDSAARVKDQLMATEYRVLADEQRTQS